MQLVFCELKSLRRCMCVCVCMYVCLCVRKREDNCVFQVEGQLLSLLLSIQQPSSLWQGLREALFRCCRGVWRWLGWCILSQPLSFKGTAHGWQAFQHSNNKRWRKNIFFFFVTIWMEDILYYKKIFFKMQFKTSLTENIMNLCSELYLYILGACFDACT